MAFSILQGFYRLAYGMFLHVCEQVRGGSLTVMIGNWQPPQYIFFKLRFYCMASCYRTICIKYVKFL